MNIITKIINRICFNYTYKQLSKRHDCWIKQTYSTLKEINDYLVSRTNIEKPDIATLMSEALLILFGEYKEHDFYNYLEKIEEIVLNSQHDSLATEITENTCTHSVEYNSYLLSLSDISKNAFSWKLAEFGYIHYINSVNPEIHPDEYFHSCMSLVDIYQHETNLKGCVEIIANALNVAKKLENSSYKVICLARLLGLRTALKSTDPFVNIDYSLDFLYYDLKLVCDCQEQRLIELLDVAFMTLYKKAGIDNCLLIHILRAKQDLLQGSSTNADLIEDFNEDNNMVAIIKNAKNIALNLSEEEKNVASMQEASHETLAKSLLSQYMMDQLVLFEDAQSNISMHLWKSMGELAEISHSPFLELLSHYIRGIWYYAEKNDTSNYEEEYKTAMRIMDNQHRLADAHSFLSYFNSVVMQLIAFMDCRKEDKLVVINEHIDKIDKNTQTSRSWYIGLLNEKLECYDVLSDNWRITAKEILDEAKSDIVERFLYMTHNQRAQLLSVWQEKTNSIITCNSNSVIVDVYDLLSLEKGVLLTTSREIRKYLSSIEDSKHLATLFEDFEEEERKLKRHSNNNTSIGIKQMRMKSLELNTELMKLKKQGLTSKLYFGLDKLQSVLKKKDVVIDMHSYNKGDGDIHYFAYIITSSQITRIDMCDESDLIGFSESCHDAPWTLYENTSLGRSFFSLIWKNLFLDKDLTLYISPTGSLLKIAFDNLVVNDIGTTLSESFTEVIRISHPRYIKKIKEEVDLDFEQEEKAVFGNMNYGKEAEYESTTLGYGFNHFENKINSLTSWGNLKKNDECNNIAQIFNVSTKKQKEEFLALNNSTTSILHTMTHGFFFNLNQVKHLPKFASAVDEMDTSGIIFEGANKAWTSDDDNWNGILRSSDIAQMNLSSIKLAVLSVCDSANGLIDRDGLMGLQRALKLAGVNTIVHSLWDVDVNTSQRFTFTFYRNLMKGMSKREAFKHTINKIRMESNESLAYPASYYYARYIMID